MTTLKEVLDQIREIERHFHIQGEGVKWFGSNAGVPTRDFGTPFTLTSGNDDFGNEILIVDDDTTPVEANMVKFDMNDLVLESTNQEGIWYVQVWVGNGDGTFGNAELRTTGLFIVNATGANLQSVVTSYMGTGRANSGRKCWLKAKCAGQNAKLLDVFPGMHEYTD